MPRIPAFVNAVLLLGAVPALAQAQQRPLTAIAGRVVDTAGTPLAGARVVLIESSRTTATAADGRFRFGSVAAGTYTLSIARIGFAPASRRVTVGLAPGGTAGLELRLVPARVHLAAVQVTATPAATLAMDSPQPTAVMEGPELRVAQGAALGETLEQVPGLRSLSMTTGIGKPVIRGMTHYRVVTLDNGQRTETQAWGHDHSPNVETATAERVEVIKGPASVLYGSDALGGVVNVVAPAIPDAIDQASFVRGRVTTAYSHNVRGGDGTLQVEAARGGTGARASLTRRGSGDMRTPAGALGNTTNDATAVEGAVGYRASWGALSGRYTGRAERIEIFDDPAANPGYSGYQRIATQRATVELNAPLGTARLQGTVGFEENFRREFAAATAAEPDLGLFVRNWTGVAHLHHQPVGPVSGTFGLSAMTSDFENRGTQTLIPSSGSRNVAAYLFEQASRGRWRATVGARYDHRTLATDGNAAIAVPAQRRAFHAVTGSAGLLFKASEPVGVVLNVARGFRAPAAPDLFANGFHEGTRAFERGDPTLRVETSLNTELGVRVTRPSLSAEVTGFVNTVDDYIYLRPFGSGGRAFDSLQVVQGDARLRGFEGRIAWQPVRRVTLHAATDYVHGQNTTARVPLTLIPPLRALYGIRFEEHGFYATLAGETNARQTRLDPRDVGTPGYSLAAVGAGITRPVQGSLVTLDLSVKNLLDTEYRSFMSRYKEFAHGPGRGITVRASTTF